MKKLYHDMNNGASPGILLPSKNSKLAPPPVEIKEYSKKEVDELKKKSDERIRQIIQENDMAE